jgi:hypothetical protein
MTAWQDPAWQRDAAAWVADRLTALGTPPTGPADVVHVQAWSTVHRVPTAAGPRWFKATAPALRHEVAVHAVVSARRPDCVPTLLAADADRGWMLMADAGERLREVVARERSVDAWLDVLPLYAGLQRDCTDDVPALLAAGAPDLRLAVLPDAYARTVDEVAPALAAGGTDGADLAHRAAAACERVREMCAELAAAGPAETLQHDDLNDGQVYRGADGYRVLDWGDACVTHPFLSLSVAVEGVIAWGPDDVEGAVATGPFVEAYLAPFAPDLPVGDGVPAGLRTAARTALRLGWACRAVNGHRSGLEEVGRTATRLRMFLDGHP